MALGTTKISALAGPGLSAAAATARPLSGGRGVAAAAQSPVEESTFAGSVGVNDNSILHHDDDTGFDPNGQRRDTPDQGTPFVSHSAFGFQVADADQSAEAPQQSRFLNEVLRGIGVYEYTLKVIAPNSVRPGSVVNHLF